ncbi:MAG: GntR family transcriptional regulator [Proteobacteria bacterium]|nr:GntR family transcriptional regulator [Pseudomonadota bacterium]
MTKKITASKGNLDAMVREELRDQILSGALPNGTHLSEIKISKSYNVSRTPVREALCALAADGLIEMIPNRGAFVRTPSDAQTEELRDMYGSLMGMACRMSAEKMSETDIARMERAISAMTENNGSDFDAAREQVHGVILSTLGSDIFDSLMRMVEGRMSRPLMAPVFDGHRRAEIQQAYGIVATAFKRAKGDVAEKTMRDAMALNMTMSTVRDATAGAA